MDSRHRESIDPQAFKHCSQRLRNGHVYHYIDEVPDTGKATRGVCLLLHGFPDLWYGWRYQIIGLKKAGFRCIVPSTLGYAGSSKPDDLRAYGFKAMSTDLKNLLSAIGIEEPVLLFGHDWGGLLAWRFAAYYPEVVKSIAVVSTPYAPPAQHQEQWTDLETLVKTKLPNFGYQLFFASKGADKLIQDNLPAFFGFIFGEPKPGAQSHDAHWTSAGVLSQKLAKLDKKRIEQDPVASSFSVQESPETSYYVQTYRTHGIRHPLMYYQTRRICFEEEIASSLPASFPAGKPALFITGTNDPALPLGMSKTSALHFQQGQYHREIVQDADHWLLQRAQSRTHVTNILVSWALQTYKHPVGKIHL